MRYWFDTEFIEDGKTIDLLSLGMVSEDNCELYFEISRDEVDWNKACPWVKENVLNQLGKIPTISRTEAKGRILQFIGEDVPEFWGYFADYDWVVLCQLFGTMMDLPKGWPMFCWDVRQLKPPGVAMPGHTGSEHHALDDARWTKEAWQILSGI